MKLDEAENLLTSMALGYANQEAKKIYGKNIFGVAANNKLFSFIIKEDLPIGEKAQARTILKEAVKTAIETTPVTVYEYSPDGQTQERTGNLFAAILATNFQLGEDNYLDEIL